MYRIIPDTAVSEQVAALPAETLAGYLILEEQQEVHLLLVQWWG